MKRTSYYRIGHPAYQPWSQNHFVQLDSYAKALSELLTRGISMSDAHAALKRGYSTVTTRKGNPVEIDSTYYPII